jgi:hypothetical protein
VSSSERVQTTHGEVTYSAPVATDLIGFQHRDLAAQFGVFRQTHAACAAVAAVVVLAVGGHFDEIVGDQVQQFAEGVAETGETGGVTWVVQGDLGVDLLYRQAPLFDQIEHQRIDTDDRVAEWTSQRLRRLGVERARIAAAFHQQDFFDTQPIRLLLLPLLQHLPRKIVVDSNMIDLGAGVDHIR